VKQGLKPLADALLDDRSLIRNTSQTAYIMQKKVCLIPQPPWMAQANIMERILKMRIID